MKQFWSGVTSSLRTVGQGLDRIGMKLEVNPYVDKLQPSLRAHKLGKTVPSISCSFVSSSSTVIGNVSIGKGSSIWYGSVIRGDVNSIVIGERVTVGDRSVIHCSGLSKKSPTVIGNDVVIGAGSIIHGCKLEDGVVIGEGAQVLDGAVVQKGASISAGSIVTQGKIVPSGQLWAGVPAVFIRNLSSAEIEVNENLSAENLKLAVDHAIESSKCFEEIEDDEYEYEQTVNRNESYHKRRSLAEVSKNRGEIEGHMFPGLILNSKISGERRPVDEAK